MSFLVDDKRSRIIRFTLFACAALLFLSLWSALILTFASEQCEELSPALKDVVSCYRENDNALCSGKGACVNGTCDCSGDDFGPKYYGEFCECDDTKCDTAFGTTCWGRGACECGVCYCRPGWTGKMCECPQDACIEPASGIACTGNGQCLCGECECDENEEGIYAGKHCERFFRRALQCNAFKECVQCQVFKTGPLTQEQCAYCQFMSIDRDRLRLGEYLNEHFCSFHDDDGCKFYFKYFILKDRQDDMYPRALVYVQRDKRCSKLLD